MFEKINEIDEPLARVIKINEKTQITKTRNENGNISTAPTVLNRTIKEYYELYANKFNNVNEINIYLEKEIYQTDTDETENL